MKNRVGLALSGGGYRASAFHLGTLRKLKELNVLDKIDVISTISGGSITGAYYALHGKIFESFENGLREGLKKSSIITFIIYLIFLLTSIILSFILIKVWWIELIWILLLAFTVIKFQFAILPVSYFVEKRYDRIFFKGAKLKDISTIPILCINSTNIESQRQFSFSKIKMSDSFYAYPEDGSVPVSFKHSEFPVSKAVMASTCVPFVFTPVKISKKYYRIPNDYKRIHPKLIDGGVYDNQGIHKLTQKGSEFYCDNIVVSDAGTGYKPWFSNNTISLLIKTSDLFMTRIKNIQFVQNVILNKHLASREIAYFSLWYNPNDSIYHFVDLLKKEVIADSVLESHGLTKDFVKAKSTDELIDYMKEKIEYGRVKLNFPTEKEMQIAKKVGTGLSPLKNKKVEALIKIAEALTEIQIKLYFPTLLK